MDGDRVLMQRVAQGEEAAFVALVERYGAPLLGVARRLLDSRVEAEDAVQRAFLRCFTEARRYQPRWAVSTWLYRILTNICIDELRRRATRAPLRALVPDAGRVASRSPGPVERLDLRRALAGLPTEARVLLALRYVDGCSYGELARIRGISVNTVKSQLARGKALLRARLGQGGER